MTTEQITMEPARYSESLEDAMLLFTSTLPDYKYAFTEGYTGHEPIIATVWQGEVIQDHHSGTGNTHSESLYRATLNAARSNRPG